MEGSGSAPLWASVDRRRTRGKTKGRFMEGMLEREAGNVESVEPSAVV
jgi:hypothetical protein